MLGLLAVFTPYSQEKIFFGSWIWETDGDHRGEMIKFKSTAKTTAPETMPPTLFILNHTVSSSLSMLPFTCSYQLLVLFTLLQVSWSWLWFSRFICLSKVQGGEVPEALYIKTTTYLYFLCFLFIERKEMMMSNFFRCQTEKPLYSF